MRGSGPQPSGAPRAHTRPGTPLRRLPAAAPRAFPGPRPPALDCCLGPRRPSPPRSTHGPGPRCMTDRRARTTTPKRPGRQTSLGGEAHWGPLGPCCHLSRTGPASALLSGLPLSAHVSGSRQELRRGLAVCAQTALRAVLTLNPGSPVAPLPWPTTRSQPARPLLSELPNARWGPARSASDARGRGPRNRLPRSSSRPRAVPAGARRPPRHCCARLHPEPAGPRPW